MTSNVLLIGNSKQVVNKPFIMRQDIAFKHVCRFNHNWACVYDKVKRHTGDQFDTLITSHYAHDVSIRELKTYKLLHKVEKVFLISPNTNHSRQIRHLPQMDYERITDNEHAIIRDTLVDYKFPIDKYIPRTGITSIIYFVFVRRFKVYLLGMDVYGTDDPNDQHIKKNHKIDLINHSIEAESKLLIQLMEDKKCFLYEDI